MVRPIDTSNPIASYGEACDLQNWLSRDICFIELCEGEAVVFSGSGCDDINGSCLGDAEFYFQAAGQYWGRRVLRQLPVTYAPHSN